MYPMLYGRRLLGIARCCAKGWQLGAVSMLGMNRDEQGWILLRCSLLVYYLTLHLKIVKE